MSLKNIFPSMNSKNRARIATLIKSAGKIDLDGAVRNPDAPFKSARAFDDLGMKHATQEQREAVLKHALQLIIAIDIARGEIKPSKAEAKAAKKAAKTVQAGGKSSAETEAA